VVRDGLGERSEAIIREAARVADGTRTQDEALAYLADFSRAIGVPDHQSTMSAATATFLSCGTIGSPRV
jgi:hypothetical protein